MNSTLEADDRHVEGREKVEVAEPRVSPVVVHKVAKLLLWTELREFRTSRNSQETNYSVSSQLKLLGNSKLLLFTRRILVYEQKKKRIIKQRCPSRHGSDLIHTGYRYGNGLCC